MDTYLRLRSEHDARRRGYEPGQTFDPGRRIRAIKQMETRFEGTQLKAAATIASIGWTAIGPAPIPNGQTNGVDNPVSGRVTAIDVHPTNANIAYVGTAQGGLYRTLDGGLTWTALMDTAQSLAIGAVTIDPLNPSIVFVGTGEGNQSLDSFFGVGLYRIEQADTAPVLIGPFETRVTGTGTAASNGHAFVGTAINRIVVDPANDNRIFVGNTFGSSGTSGDSICCGGTTPPSGFMGLYFSPNALSASPTFSRVNVTGFTGQQDVTDVVFEPGSSDNLLMGVEDFGGAGLSGIYRTTNASTASQSPSVAPAFTRVLTLAAVNSKLAINKVGATVTVLAATGASNGRLLQSTDGGATFPTTLTAASGFCGGQCFYNIALAMDPANASIIFIAGNVASGGAKNFAVSKDGGTTFTERSTGVHADSHAIAIAPSNHATIYFGNDGGVFVGTFSSAATPPTISWVSRNTATFNATQFESIAVHPSDAFFSIGGTQDNGTNFYKPDQSWTRADSGDGGFAAIDQNAVNTTTVVMYHTYFNQSGSQIGFARVDSTANAQDGGWAFFGCGGTANGINCTDNVLFYAPLALGPGNPNTLYFGSDRLYRSVNKGVAVSQVSQVLPAAVSAIGISPQNDSVRIVGLDNGQVFATTTGANPLIDVTGSIPAKYVARAVIDPSNSNTAYVTLDGYGLAANQHVWKTTNLNGAPPTWNPIGGTASNFLGDIPVNAFAVDINDANQPGVAVLYAGTDIGVFQSVDGGGNWFPFGSGLPRVAVFDMAIQGAHRILRIATHGRGMWEIPLPLAGTPTPTPVSTSTGTNTPTGTPTNTPPPTPTNTNTATSTPTSTPTTSASATPTRTPTRTPTQTPTSTTTQTPTITNTSTPTASGTNTPTSTPTRTATLTATRTPTPTVSNTPTQTATFTSTLTQTPTNTPTATASTTPTLTSTRTPTQTPTSTPTHTSTPSNTSTSTPTSTSTATNTSSRTPTSTPTLSPTSTATDTPTQTPTTTNTFTQTPTNTNSPTQTPTVTPTGTPTQTPTATATHSPTQTPTSTNTSISTVTSTPTVTATVTPTLIGTSTNTPTSTPTVTVTGTPTQTQTSTNTATETPTFTPTQPSTPSVTPTPTEHCTCPGDADKSNFVNASDFAAVTTNFGRAAGPTGLGDANCDGFVNATDYGVVQTNFGHSCP